MGEVDTSDLIIIITWAIDMLDTPPQAKFYKHLHVLNAREQSCTMMIMGGCKMSKTEYDLLAILYPAYGTPHKLCNIREIKISGNPYYHLIMQAEPCVSSNAPSLGSSGEPYHNSFDDNKNKYGQCIDTELTSSECAIWATLNKLYFIGQQGDGISPNRGVLHQKMVSRDKYSIYGM